MSLVNLGYVCCHIQNVSKLLKPMTSIPMSKLHLQVALGLYKEGFLSSVQRGDIYGPDKTYTSTTVDNISSRRLWLELKYRKFKPVLSRMHIVSHPNRRVFASHTDMLGLCTGKPYGKVQPLALGEVMFVRAKDKNNTVYEVHEAIANKVSGELLVRAS